MKNSKFLLCAAALFTSGYSFFVTGTTSARAQSVSSTTASGNKPQVHDLKTGTFSNGLKYYIQHNPSPASRAEIWLAVDAGSIQEDDDQLGFAHFLEHMAFNGTRKLPSNTLIDLIEQSGMTFGADLNAYTSFDQTVYQLVVPTDNQSYVDDGISIIHEWASGEILIDSMDVVMERGVVLGEWRQRSMDTVSIRQFKEYISRTMGGTNRYAERLPIGSEELIRNANPEPLRRFYQDWYRPDLMAVIVVGDIDVENVYAILKDKFEKIPAANTKRLFERPKVSYSSIPAVNIVKDRVNPLVRMEWPARIRNTSRHDYIKDRAIQSLLWGYLNDIFARYSRVERRPFAFAQLRGGSSPVRMSESTVELVIAMSPDSIKHALSYALAEVEKVAEHGIPETELSTAKAILLRSWQRTGDGVNTIPSRALATRYVEDFVNGKYPLINPVEQLEIGENILHTLSVEDLKTAAAFWKNSLNRYVTIEIPLFASVRSPSEAEVLDMMSPDAVKAYVLGRGLALPERTSTGTEAETEAGTYLAAREEKPGSIDSYSYISSEEVDTSLGIKTWKLSNGARVVFKETSNNPDEVIIHAISPGGFSKLPDKLRLSSGRLIADLMTASGSPGEKDRSQFVNNIRQSGLTRFSVVLSGFSEEVVVAGSSRRPEVLFETMYRQFTDPHIDSTALEEWKRTGMQTVTYSQQDNFAYSLTQDRRLAPPSLMSVQFMDMDKGMEVFKDRFGDASDFTFYIVGAVSEDAVRGLMGQYIATLPSANRKTPESLISTTVKQLKGNFTSTDKSPRLQAMQAVADIGFRGYLTSSNDQIIEQQQHLNTVSWILGRRLRNKLREEMSVTYGAGASAFAIPVPIWYYNIGIQFMTAPEDIGRSVDSVWSVINDLKANGPTAQELNMASRIQKRRLENAQQSNAWWVSQLSSYDRMGIPFGGILEGSTNELSVEQYKEQIRKFLPDDSYTQSIAVPTDETIKKAKEEEANRK